MEDKIIKLPNIRFSEFIDSWEQRKLAELATFSKGQGYSKNDLVEEGTPIILYGRLYTKYQTLISDVDTFVIEKPKSIYSTGKEVIVPSSGESAEDIARASAIAKSGVLLGGDLNIIYPNEDIDSSFLAVSISNGEQQKRLSKKAQGKSVVHLRNVDLQEFIFSYPSYKEQLRITTLILEIEKLITLHQQKVELLNDIKNSMLQKIFPRGEECVPKFRFEGFSDSWEKRKFSELYEKVNEKNDLSFGPDKIISVANMYYKKELNTNSTEEYMRTYNIFRVGDIAFEGNKNKKYSYGRFVENDIGDGIVSHVFDVFRPIGRYDLWFWKYLINNESIMGHILRRTTTKATMMTNLVAKDFLKATILVPNIEEQKKIGDYLKHLDNFIDLHQDKLDLLKVLKKSMNQQMFIQ